MGRSKPLRISKLLIALAVVLGGVGIGASSVPGVSLNRSLDDPDSSTSNPAAIVKAYRARQEQYKDSAELLTYQSLLLERVVPLGSSAELCVDCTQVPRLVKAVNEAIERLAAEDPEYARSGALERIHRVHALSSLNIERSGVRSCPAGQENTSDLEFLNPELRADRMALIFSKEIDPSRIEALELAGSGATVRYYRGTGNQRDIIIRVETPTNGRSKISYYRLKPGPSYAAPRPDDYRGYWQHMDSENPGELTVNYGVAFRERFGLADKVILLDMKYKPTSNVEVIADVSSKKAISTVQLKGDDHRPLVSASVYPGGRGVRAELAIPTELKLSNLTAKGELKVSDKDILGVYALKTDRSDLGVTSVKTSNTGREQEVVHTKNLDAFSTISVKYRRDAESPRPGTPGQTREDNSVWLRYELKFF